MATQITDTAQSAFLAGIIVALIGIVLVSFRFLKMEEERKMLADYHAQDIGYYLNVCAAVPGGCTTSI